MTSQERTHESLVELGDRVAQVLGQVTTHLETFDARILMLSARLDELEARIEARE